MIADLKPYSSMKESGHLWLGDFPAHWDVRRNGRLFAQRIQTGYPALPILEVSLKTGVRVRDFEISDRKQVMSDKAKYKRAKQGDIAYNMMRMWQGAVGVAPVDGLVSPAYVVARPIDESNSAYFEYLFRTASYMREVNKYSRGIVSDRNRLYWEDFKQMPSPFPPPEEQAAIVRFLGYADRRIRRYIGLKQKLIKLLEEQKQLIVHRAVTRGLDPSAPLKPSGVEWLGNVPEHWEVLPLKRWVSTKITDGPHETPPLLDEGISFMSAESMVNGRLDFDRRRGFISRELHEIYCRKCRPQVGDIFMCKSGATTGKVVIVDTDAEFSVWSPLALIRVNPARVVSRLLFSVLQSRYVQRQVQDTWSYGTQPNLAMSAMERLLVVLPPLEEQREIIEFLDREMQTPLVAIDEANREIGLLREYRTRLIADVVTGKLDVREAASLFPKETEDLEPLADADEGATGDLDAVPEEAEA